MSYWTAQEHAMWHLENGPSGAYGVSCPWDACGYAWSWDEEMRQQEAAERAEEAALAPALREGEEPAPLARYGYRPDANDAPDPWMDPNAFDPPF